ncbi:DUF805 domain-containing protein [Catenovulum maritimum]|uniref:DUF805 domain-containing protein n=1 Tax=Catenovulum maritimum TaxID=1513271 RepID=UPI000660D49C|nr:DUF805 domain-containing protein [Catenovulum maritimum]
MENTENLFTAPEAELVTENQGYSTPKIFQASGRLGRVRYLAHASISYLVLLPAAGLFAISETLGAIGIAVGYAFMFYITIVAGIKRLHDINRKGWYLLLLFVPLINLILVLILLFKSGDIGENEYGLPAHPNTAKTWILGLVMPLIFIIGILAAIAVPAYNDYLQAAQNAAAS